MPRPNVRDKLIDAGMRTLYQRGFNGCAVQDITEAAGVPKGSFYNHFDSKEALAVEAVERFWQESATRRVMLSDESLPPVERLKQHFRRLNKLNLDMGCLIGNFSAELAAQSRPVRDRLAMIWAAWSKGIEICVREAADAGQLRPGLVPEDVAAFLISAWEGAVLRAKVDHDQSALERFERVVFAGLFV